MCAHKTAAGEVACRVAVLVSQSQRELMQWRAVLKDFDGLNRLLKKKIIVQGRIKVVSGKKLLRPCFFFLEKNILGIEGFMKPVWNQ